MADSQTNPTIPTTSELRKAMHVAGVDQKAQKAWSELNIGESCVRCHKLGQVCTRKSGLARCDPCNMCHRVCSLRIDFIRQYISRVFGLDESTIQKMIDGLAPLRRNTRLSQRRPILTGDAVHADQNRSSPLSDPPEESDGDDGEEISNASRIDGKRHENVENSCDDFQVATDNQPSISRLSSPQPRQPAGLSVTTVDQQQQIKGLEEAVEKVSIELVGLREQYAAREKIMLAQALSREQELTRALEVREKTALEEASAREQELREGFELRAKELASAAEGKEQASKVKLEEELAARTEDHLEEVSAILKRERELRDALDSKEQEILKMLHEHQQELDAAVMGDEHKGVREKFAKKQMMLDRTQNLLDTRNQEFDDLHEKVAAAEDSMIQAEIRAEAAEAELQRALRHVADVQEHCGGVEQEKEELLRRLKKQVEQFEMLSAQQRRTVMPEYDHTPVLSKAAHRISFASRYLREDKPATALHLLDEAHRELSGHLERELLSQVGATSNHDWDSSRSRSPDGQMKSTSSKGRDRDIELETEDPPLKKLRGATW